MLHPPTFIHGCPPSCEHLLPDGTRWCGCGTRVWPLDWDGLYTYTGLPNGAKYFQSDIGSPSIDQALRDVLRDGSDPCLSIDLQWPSDTEPGSNNKVAVVSIANGISALLINTSSIRDLTLPAPLRDLLRDPTITWIAQGWGRDNEGKFQDSFGLGRADFAGTFIDLDDVAGLHNLPTDPEALAETVLDATLWISDAKKAEVWNSPKVRGKGQYARVRPNASQRIFSALVPLTIGAAYRAIRATHAGVLCRGAWVSLRPEGSSSFCLVCNLECRSEESLERHLRGMRHKETLKAMGAVPIEEPEEEAPEEEAPPPEDPEPEPAHEKAPEPVLPHRCWACGTRFPTTEALRKHEGTREHQLERDAAVQRRQGRDPGAPAGTGGPTPAAPPPHPPSLPAQSAARAASSSAAKDALPLTGPVTFVLPGGGAEMEAGPSKPAKPRRQKNKGRGEGSIQGQGQLQGARDSAAYDALFSKFL